jgi:UDP-N-acetylmuramoyl-tripeptide--D-alanyl-D-alanine ligase
VTLTFEEILAATGGRVLAGEGGGVAGVSIDTRTMGAGDIYIALRGARHDGHEFAARALELGRGVIVEAAPPGPAPDGTVVAVGDTLRALQAMGRAERVKRGVPVVAVTGTNGKTTTKEMAALVLGARYRVMKNEGNLNNHIGLPLSILRFAGEGGVMVLEMGASRAGDIAELCGIALPEIGVLTNVGPGHLEGFGSIEAVRETKLEMLGAVKTAVLNVDDAFLMEGVRGYAGEVIGYGLSEGADVRGSDIEAGASSVTFTLHAGGDRARVTLGVAGAYNVMNALGAAAVGVKFGIPVSEIAEALGRFRGVPMRLEVREEGGVLYLRDMYNANPASMRAALAELIRLRRGRAVAVLGDMLELGARSGEMHRALGRLAREAGVDLLIAVGPAMEAAAGEFRASGGEAVSVGRAREAREAMAGLLRAGDTVLVKGSRGMRMEEALGDAL